MVPAASICISARNRGRLLKTTLESIQRHGYENTETIVVDDGSTDDTQAVLKEESWVRTSRIERSGGYRNDPAVVFNATMAMARGDVLIQQSAEVVHLTPVARQLMEACEIGVPSFSTVLAGDERQLQPVWQAVSSGWMMDGCEWSGMDHPWILPKAYRPDGGLGVAVPPVPVIAGRERVEVYTGVQRPVPFFFCGAIRRDDWRKTGGYPEGVPMGASDLHLAIRMMTLGFRFRFLGSAIAFHVAHGKT